jgi:hypothetical protein
MTYEQAERIAIKAADGLATERELRELEEHARRYRPGSPHPDQHERERQQRGQ